MATWIPRESCPKYRHFLNLVSFLDKHFTCLQLKLIKNGMTDNAYLLCSNSFWSVLSSGFLTVRLEMGQSYVQVKVVFFYPFCDTLAYTICKLIMFFKLFESSTGSDRVSKMQLILLNIPFMVKVAAEEWKKSMSPLESHLMADTYR